MSDDTASIPVGATQGLRVLADGSVRLTLDFEPKDRNAVMALFGAPGTPVACAALKPGYAQKSDKPARGGIGPYCREANDLSGNPEFWRWISQPGVWHEPYSADSAGAKAFILYQCGRIESRKDIDGNEKASGLFVERVRVPFMRWQRAQKAQKP